MNSWEPLGYVLGVLSVLWLMKEAFDEGIERIIKKLDQLIDISKKSRPE